MGILVLDMFEKVVRIAICMIIALLFFSALVPASTGSGGTYASYMPIFQERNENNRLGAQPILEIEEPKVLILVQGEDGDNFLIDVPESTNKEIIQERIEVEIEKKFGDAVELLEGPSISKEKPEEVDIEEIDGDIETEETAHVVLHSNNLVPIYFSSYHKTGNFNGYLMCNVGEKLHFDASYLYQQHTVSKYQWDLNGDGIYEIETLKPKISHMYSELGLYNMTVRITYSYNYTSYPYDKGYPFNDFPYKITLDTQSIANDVQSYNIQKPNNFIYQLWTVQKSIDFEIVVSVGTDEDGHPPILDFDYMLKEETEISEWSPSSNNEIELHQDISPLPSIGMMRPPSFETPVIYFSQRWMVSSLPFNVSDLEDGEDKEWAISQ